MYEHLGLATLLLILAIAGNLGDQPPACCDSALSLGPAVLVFQ